MLGHFWALGIGSMGRRKPLNSLMFKIVGENMEHMAPVFYWPDEDDIDFWRRHGWILLVTEREVRFADLDEIREEDEKGRR